MGPKEHYDNHLASLYAWMLGDLQAKVEDFLKLFNANHIKPRKETIALDMGCGNGIQSLALAKIGFEVIAVDFNKALLEELMRNAEGLAISAVEDDIRNVKSYAHYKPQFISCCGDTIVHLADKKEIEQFIADAAEILEPGGLLLLNFRDYAPGLEDTDRFIPVRTTSDRILTCFLEYFDDRVRITDLLYEKEKDGFIQYAHSYFKVRLSTDDVIMMCDKAKLQQTFLSSTNRRTTIILQKN
jgi:SAM-dependent methyltransferase